MMYGREALRRMREQQERAAQEPQRQPSLLEMVPPDAPMDEATVTVWNGERFAAYDKWLATAPVAIDEPAQVEVCTILAAAGCLAGDCGANRVWLVKDGGRWLMCVGSRKAGARRRDFASPYLGHAIRTAEQWYGAAGGGWREKGCDGKGANQAADLPPQDSTDEEGAGERSHDGLDLGGR